MVADQVLDILNADDHARALHHKFRLKAAECGLEPGTLEYKQAEQVVLMLCLYRNDEAMCLLAEETYRLANA